MSYSTSIFKSAGVDISILATVIATSVCFVSTAACALVVDTFGRRTMLLVSCYVMAAAAAVRPSVTGGRPPMRSALPTVTHRRSERRSML